MISKTYIVRCDGDDCLAEGEQECTRSEAIRSARAREILPVYDKHAGKTMHFCLKCRMARNSK